MKIREAETAVDKEWENLTKVQRSSCTPRFVKDDSVSYAIFTEQGPSASQVTAAKVLDIISRLSGCAGQAADAVSASTQVKMEDAPKLLQIPKSKRPDIWIRLPRHKWPKSWSSMEDPVVPLERNLYGHPLAGLLWERQFEKVLLEHGWEEVPECECLFVIWEKDYSCLYVDDIKLGGKKQDINRTWKIFMKMLIWENQHHSLTTFTLVALKENEKPAKILMTILNDLCRSYRKITQLAETWCEHIYMVLWHGRSCKEIRGKILRIFERNPPAIV